MADWENYRDQRRKWREERRRMRDEWRSKFHDRRNYVMGGVHLRGRMWTGVFILLIGVVTLLNVSNTIPPDWNWIYSWPMFLIALGLFIGIRHRFYGFTWLILMLIGGAFLANDYLYPNTDLHRYIWPVALIILGIAFILRPRRQWQGEDDEKKNTYASDLPTDPVINPEAANSNDDFVNATSVFGGTKKNILSKNFKGGELVNIFGGIELNLSQADISREAVIEMTTIFGGTKLIVPANWIVKSDAAVIFGGIEDKRPMPGVNDPAGKVLRLKGTVIFGGIDIKSY